MSNLGWTCPTCKTNWAPSVLKCDCGPIDAIGIPLKPSGGGPDYPQPYGTISGSTGGTTDMSGYWIGPQWIQNAPLGPGGTA